MKIKFRNSDGVITAVGLMPDLKPGKDETVEEFKGDFPEKRIDFYIRKGPNTLEEIPQEDQDAITAEDSFNVNFLTGGLGQSFVGEDAINLSPYLCALQSYSQAKNFSGVKDFVNGLVDFGKATKDQGARIKKLFFEQGIDLDAY